MIGTTGGPQCDGQHNPGFHGVPPSTPRDGGFESPFGVRHGGGALTCGEFDLRADPAPADAGPPPGVLARGPGGQPPRGSLAPQREVVGGQAEQGVGPRAGGVEAIGVGLGVEGGGFGEGLAVEGAGLAVAAQLPPVGSEGAGGEGGHHRVAVVPKGVEEGGRGGVPSLGAEDDGGEQPFPRGAGPARDGGIGQRITPERGGPQGGFVHASFLAGPTDRNMIEVAGVAPTAPDDHAPPALRAPAKSRADPAGLTSLDQGARHSLGSV